MTPAEAGGLWINVPFLSTTIQVRFFSLVPQKKQKFIWLFSCLTKRSLTPKKRFIFFLGTWSHSTPFWVERWVDTLEGCWYPWCRYRHLKLNFQGLPMLQMINSWIQKHHFYLRLKKFLSTVICQQLPEFRTTDFGLNVCSSLSSNEKKTGWFGHDFCADFTQTLWKANDFWQRVSVACLSIPHGPHGQLLGTKWWPLWDGFSRSVFFCLTIPVSNVFFFGSWGNFGSPIFIANCVHDRNNCNFWPL